jgi:hypothetical protein
MVTTAGVACPTGFAERFTCRGDDENAWGNRVNADVCINPKPGFVF